jgi:hypothetical protein
MRRVTVFLFVALLLVGCSVDSYKTGDGGLSYLTVEFGEVKTAEATTIVGFSSDDGLDVNFSRPYTAEWADKANGTYRALVYYDKVEKGSIFAHSISQIPVVKPLITNRPDTVKTDPLIFESAWKSTNGKYLNVGFYVKTGTADGKINKQLLGVWREKVVEHADGTKDVYLKVMHSQNKAPEFYRTKGYMSIPIDGMQNDRIFLSVITYDGEVTKTFPTL